MERGLVMLGHSAAIAVVLYLIMLYALKYAPLVAEKWSLMWGAAILIYMLQFGHALPRF